MATKASTALVRHLLLTEKHRLRDHLLRLGSPSRCMRFNSVVNDELIQRYTRALDWRRHIALGAFVHGTLRGAAECHIESLRWSLVGELAFSVEEHYQGLGIGSRLCTRVFNFARNRGIRKLYMVTLSENSRMLRLARTHGMSITMDNEMHVSVDLTKPTWASLVQEVEDEISAWLRMAQPAHNPLMQFAG